MTKLRSSRWSVASIFISPKLTYEDCTNHRKSSNQGGSCRVPKLLRTRTILYTSLKKQRRSFDCDKGLSHQENSKNYRHTHMQQQNIWDMKGDPLQPKKHRGFYRSPKVNKETPDFLLNACSWNPSSTWGKYVYLSHMLNNTLDILWDMQTNNETNHISRVKAKTIWPSQQM